MAAPITFRNVPGASAPNFGGSLFAQQRAADAPNLFEVFGELAQDEVNTQRQLDTDAFVAQLNSFRDRDPGDGSGVITADAQRQEFLAQQLANNSFIDAGKASQAVTSNRAQDFLQNAEGRAQSAEERAISGEERAVQDQNRKEFQFEDTLQNSTISRDTQKLTNEVQRENLKITQRNNEIAEQNRTRTETNRIMQSTPVFNQHDFLVIQPKLSDPANAEYKDFLHADTVMRQELREQFPDLTYAQYNKKIENAYKANGLGPARNAAITQANRTPAGKLEFNKLQRVAKENFEFNKKLNTSLEKASTITDDKAFVNEYAKIETEAGLKTRDPADLDRLSVFRTEAMNRFTPDISTDPIHKLTIPQIGSQQIAAFTRRTAKKVYSKFPDAAPSEVLRLVRIAGDTGADGLRTKLNTAEAVAQINAEIGQIARNQAKRQIVAPGEAKIKALETDLTKQATIDQTGTSRSQLRLNILEALKPGGKLNLEGVEVDQEELGLQTSRMFDLLDEVLPEANGSQKARVIQELMLSQGGVAKGTIFNVLTQGFDTFDDQPGLSDDEGDVEPLSDFKDAELVDRMLFIWSTKVNSKESRIKDLKKQLKALENK